MARIIYFDCFSGCSGDMILGALLDAGFSLSELEAGLSTLNLSGYRISSQRVKRAAISATAFKVEVEGHQPARSLADILAIIEASGLDAQVKQKSSEIFSLLGKVEAEVHGIPLEKVHFHEIGAVDSIIDIVGTILALNRLKIEKCYSSALPAGSGFVSTAHGTLPVPAPATLKLLAMAKAPLVNLPQPEIQGEMVTPTGAALITSLAEFARPELRVEAVGHGAGSREYEKWPNVLRVWTGESAEKQSEGNLILFETNIDDTNPQFYGYLMEKLFEEKALDVWFTPIQMKKNRPAIMLSVLAPAEIEAGIIDVIMRETSTLGVRTTTVSRHTAEREIIEFDSSLGPAHAKIKRFGGDLLSVSPEYEDCRIIAREKSLPLPEVFRIIESEGRAYIEGHELL